MSKGQFYFKNPASQILSFLTASSPADIDKSPQQIVDEASPALHGILKNFVSSSLTSILQFRKLKPSSRSHPPSDVSSLSNSSASQPPPPKRKKWNLEEYLEDLEQSLSSGDRTFRVSLLLYISDGANRVLAEKWVYEIIHFPPQYTLDKYSDSDALGASVHQGLSAERVHKTMLTVKTKLEILLQSLSIAMGSMPMHDAATSATKSGLSLDVSYDFSFSNQREEVPPELCFMIPAQEQSIVKTLSMTNVDSALCNVSLKVCYLKPFKKCLESLAKMSQMPASMMFYNPLSKTTDQANFLRQSVYFQDGQANLKMSEYEFVSPGVSQPPKPQQAVLAESSVKNAQPKEAKTPQTPRVEEEKKVEPVESRPNFGNMRAPNQLTHIPRERANTDQPNQPPSLRKRAPPVVSNFLALAGDPAVAQQKSDAQVSAGTSTQFEELFKQTQASPSVNYGGIEQLAGGHVPSNEEDSFRSQGSNQQIPLNFQKFKVQENYIEAMSQKKKQQLSSNNGSSSMHDSYIPAAPRERINSGSSFKDHFQKVVPALSGLGGIIDGLIGKTTDSEQPTVHQSGNYTARGNHPQAFQELGEKPKAEVNQSFFHVSQSQVLDAHFNGDTAFRRRKMTFDHRKNPGSRTEREDRKQASDTAKQVDTSLGSQQKSGALGGSKVLDSSRHPTFDSSMKFKIFRTREQNSNQPTWEPFNPLSNPVPTVEKRDSEKAIYASRIEKSFLPKNDPNATHEYFEPLTSSDDSSSRLSYFCGSDEKGSEESERDKLIRKLQRYNKHKFKSPKQVDSPTTIHRAQDIEDDEEDASFKIGSEQVSVLLEEGESFSSLDLEIQTGEDKLDLFCKLISDADTYFQKTIASEEQSSTYKISNGAAQQEEVECGKKKRDEWQRQLFEIMMMRKVLQEKETLIEDCNRQVQLQLQQHCNNN